MSHHEPFADNRADEGIAVPRSGERLLAARHAEIAAEAGVSVSAVFVYFPTRAALVGEVDALCSALVVDALADDAPVPDALLRLARTFVASVEVRPDHARVWLDRSAAFGSCARSFRATVGRTAPG